MRRSRVILGGVFSAVATLAVLSPVLGSLPAGAQSNSGALLGVYPGESTFSSLVTPPDYTYLNDMDAWQESANGGEGNANSIVNFYEPAGDEMFVDSTNSNFSQSGYGDATKIWVEQHKVPFLSLTTQDQSMTAIANGHDPVFMNGALKTFATNLGTWVNATLDVNGTDYYPPVGGRQIYIRLDWEPNGTWYDWSPSQDTCGGMYTDEVNYVKAWQNIRTEVMTDSGLSSTNVQWVYSVNNVDALKASMKNCTQTVTVGPFPSVPIQDMAEAMYPGWSQVGGTWDDNDVDWVGVDGYSRCGAISPADVFSTMFGDLNNVITDNNPAYPPKPLAVTEVGASTESDDNSANCTTSQSTVDAKASWITSYFSYVEQNNIKMSLWFNNNQVNDLVDKQDWAVFAPDISQTDSKAYDFPYTGPSGASYYTYSEYPSASASMYFFGNPNNDQCDVGPGQCAPVISTTEFQGDFTPTT